MPNADPMHNSAEGPAEQEARYQDYEKRRKRQETEHKDMDFFIDDIVNKILNSEDPKNIPSDQQYDYKYRPGRKDQEDEGEGDDDEEGEKTKRGKESRHPKPEGTHPGGGGGRPKGISFPEQIRQIYKTHAPKKLKEVPRILEKYKGREKLLMQKVMKKYMPFVAQSGTRRKSTAKSRQQARRARGNNMKGMPDPSESREVLNMEDTYTALLFELYTYIDKERLDTNTTFIPLMLKKYEKREDVLIEAILQKYFTDSLYAWKFGAVLGTEENDATAFSFQLKSYYSKINPDKVGKVDDIVKKFSNMRIQRKVVGAILEKYMPELNEWMSRGVTVAVSDNPPKSQYDIPNWMREKMGGMK